MSNLVGLGGFGLGGLLGGSGTMVGARLFDGLPQRDGQTDHQRRCNAGSGGKDQLVSANEFLKAVEVAGRTGDDRFVLQMPLNVRGQAIGRFAAAGGGVFEGFVFESTYVAAES